MASIDVNSLNLGSTCLFLDSESYLDELVVDEMTTVSGGHPTILLSLSLGFLSGVVYAGWKWEKF